MNIKYYYNFLSTVMGTLTNERDKTIITVKNLEADDSIDKVIERSSERGFDRGLRFTIELLKPLFSTLKLNIIYLWK